MRLFIYKITNKLNGKAYIGKTTKEPSWRWKRHLHDNRPGIGQIIREFGKDNFTFEVIHTAESLDELECMEIQYIKRYNTFHPDGYNLTTGGNNGKYSELSRQQISRNKKKFISENN